MERQKRQDDVKRLEQKRQDDVKFLEQKHEDDVKRLELQVAHEKAMREKDLEKERALWEREVQKEQALREEMARRANDNVDRRTMDLLFASEYEKLRAALDKVKKGRLCVCARGGRVLSPCDAAP
jgi:hypothetical protein